jgi:predicted GNAT family acetyltransferase
LFNGTYGSSWPAASFVVERDRRIVAAVLVNDHHGPLIAEVMVARDHRRQGLAGRLLLESVTVLRGASKVPPRLVVTGVNGRARRLYASLGFEVTPLPPDSTWFHPGRRGVPELLALLPSSV